MRWAGYVCGGARLRVRARAHLPLVYYLVEAMCTSQQVWTILWHFCFDDDDDDVAEWALLTPASHTLPCTTSNDWPLGQARRQTDRVIWTTRRFDAALGGLYLLYY